MRLPGAEPVMRWLACAAALGATACDSTVEARPQWLVTVTTDASIPRFGDRVLVEVLDAAQVVQCGSDAAQKDSCRIQLAGGTPERWPLSFGITPGATREPLRVRVRLFRAGYIGEDGLPRSPATIDMVGSLPAPSGVTTVGVRLPMKCFGVVPDLDKRLSCDPESGLLSPESELPSVASLDVGSWEPAQPVDCPAGVPDDMRCVPGGAFIFGDFAGLPVTDELAAIPEHLVALSPFAIDDDEITLGELRPKLTALGAGEPRLHIDDVTVHEAACTYLGPNDASNDALPANCLSWELANAYCASLGRRLPTEAEWEYAATSAGDEVPHPWGTDSEICDHAIIGRGRHSETLMEDTSCIADNPWGLVAGGHDGDVSRQGVRNLAGSVSEWLLDRFDLLDGPCWAQGREPLRDPRCLETDSPEDYAVRGSFYAATPFTARVTIRYFAPAAARSEIIGFRCASSW